MCSYWYRVLMLINSWYQILLAITSSSLGIFVTFWPQLISSVFSVPHQCKEFADTCFVDCQLKEFYQRRQKFKPSSTKYKCTPNALPVLAYRAYWHPHPLYALLSFSRTGNAPMYIKSSFCVSDKPLPCLSDRVNVLLVEPVQWHRSTYVYNDNSIKSIFNHWQLLVSGSLPRSHPATATAAANEPWKWVLGRCHQAIWPSDKLSSCERVGQWTGSHLGKDCNPWGWLF